MSTSSDQMRTAEVIASMCLATDLGMGFPFEHGLIATLTTMRLCESLDVDDDTRAATYYASLLMYIGCTVDGDERSRLFGGNFTENHTHRQFGSTVESLTGVARSLPSPDAPLHRRAYDVVTGLPKAVQFVSGHFASMCEVAEMLSERLGMPKAITSLFPVLTERWDGSSILRRAKGDDVPLPLRIVHVGRDASYQRLIGDDDHVKRVIESRSGGAFDPDVVAGFLSDADAILGSPAPIESVWEDVLSVEPKPWLMLEDDEIDRALAAIGAFSDLASSCLTGHSSGVARLAGAAAQVAGFEESEVVAVRRAGYVHDVGRTAIPTGIWSKPLPLTAHEREQVRLHPYHTERVLSRSKSLEQVASIAGAHHERLDGSGYHRGVDSSSLSPAARLLAAVDALQSKTEHRPYRESLSVAAAVEAISDRAKAGYLDPVMVKAVAEAAGHEAPDLDNPSGLTDREVEVIGMVAKGMLTKQIASSLDISPKTVDRHIQNSYRKIGVSSRAAATLYAAEQGLVPRSSR